MDLDFVSVHKNAKQERGQYPAILAEQACQWSMKHLLYGQKITPKNFAFGKTEREISSGQDGPLLYGWLRERAR